MKVPSEDDVWFDVETGVRVLDALTESWEADRGWATGVVDDDEADRMYDRPWLIWVRDGDNPPTFERPIEPTSAPAETVAHGRGVLSIWP